MVQQRFINDEGKFLVDVRFERKRGHRHVIGVGKMVHATLNSLYKSQLLHVWRPPIAIIKT